MYVYHVQKFTLKNVNLSLQISSTVTKLNICRNEICVHVCIVMSIIFILLLKNISGQVQFKLTAFHEIIFLSNNNYQTTDYYSPFSSASNYN